jgi:Zn-dependent protease with chaperone function
MEASMVENIIASSGVPDSTDSISKDLDKNFQVKRVAVRIVEAGQNLCAKKIDEISNEVAQNKALIAEYRHRLLLQKKKYVPKLRNNSQFSDFKPIASTASAPTLVPKAAVAGDDDIDSLRAKIAELETKKSSLDESIAQWRTGAKKLRGNWSFILLKNKVPNAFVTDLCPRRIFVNEGLLDVVEPTDDELGLILGHELSHLILEHSSAHNRLQAFLASVQLILLIFIDPTGFSSIIVDPLSSSLMRYIENSYGRQDEEAADNLGIQIAAMSCMDTRKAANIFAKFAAMEEAGGKSGRGLSSWNQTHPASKDRHAKMLLESEIHNPRSHGCGWWYFEAWNKAKAHKPSSPVPVPLKV